MPSRSASGLLQQPLIVGLQVLDLGARLLGGIQCSLNFLLAVLQTLEDGALPSCGARRTTKKETVAQTTDPKAGFNNASMSECAGD